MFEFKQQRGVAPVLMEVNGRFWGSLALAVHAGVDFPRLLYESDGPGPDDRVFEYRVPLYVRHTVRDVSLALRQRTRVPEGRDELIHVPVSQPGARGLEPAARSGSGSISSRCRIRSQHSWDGLP